MAFDRMQSYGPSKLGITSVAGQRAMDAQTRSVQNEIQEQKRTERLGRRAYRAAARGKDPSNYLKGIAALEQMRAINGTSGAGIKMAGVRQQGIEQGLASTRGQIESFNGRTVDEQGRIAPRPQSRLLGSTPENPAASSSGGEWVNVGPGASPEQPLSSSSGGQWVDVGATKPPAQFVDIGKPASLSARVTPSAIQSAINPEGVDPSIARANEMFGSVATPRLVRTPTPTPQAPVTTSAPAQSAPTLAAALMQDANTISRSAYARSVSGFASGYLDMSKTRLKQAGDLASWNVRTAGSLLSRMARQGLENAPGQTGKLLRSRFLSSP